MSDLIALSPDNIADRWGQIGAQVEAIADLSHGRLYVRDIVRAVRLGEMQLWAAMDGEKVSIMLTQLMRFPRQTDCNLISANGQNADEWLPLWPQFEAWARSEGCAVVAATHCRPGWKKLLAPLGFTETFHVLEKRLA